MSSRYKKQNWITGLFFLLNIGLIFELSMSQKDSVENIKRLLESDDVCYPSPCKNNGVCRSPDGVYHCLCAPGWGGTTCDISKDDKQCSNTSACDSGHFCNYDYLYTGFCERCPARFRGACKIEQLVNEKGLKECESSCEDADNDEEKEGTVEWTNKKLKSKLILVLLSLAAMTFILCILLGLANLRQNKRKRTANHEFVWKRNELYDSKESLDHTHEALELPDWLNDRKEMLFSRKFIVKGKQLGKGQYGTVFKGMLSQGNAVFPIAIKCSISKEPQKIDLFFEEAKTMLRIGSYHDYIVNLQGIVYEVNEDGDTIPEVDLILEYCSKGDLRSYLVKNRQDFEHSLNDVYCNKKVNWNPSAFTHDVQLLYRWTYQIADGMDFLTDRNIYHGDLAARNVLLTDTLDTKISDFGLSRRLYSDQTVPHSLRFKNEDSILPLPIKWIALELLTRHEFIPIRSDVWSFGVTLWEIFSVGKEPYGVGIDLNTLVYDLSFGVRLPTPKFCPKSITELLTKCFFERPNLRPNFKEIKSMLETAYTSLISKIKPIDASLSIKSSINEIKNNAMKIRYASVLKGNLNGEQGTLGHKDEGSIQYSTIQDFDTNKKTSTNVTKDYLQYCTLFETHTTDEYTDDLFAKTLTKNIHYKQSLDVFTLGNTLEYLQPNQQANNFHTLPKICHKN